MSKRNLWTTALVGVAVALASPIAHASYVISVVDSATGESSVAASPGESVNLSVVLTSDAEDVLDSNAFEVVFSSDGLLYESFAWDSAGFDTGSVNDFSIPGINDLPQIVTADSYLAGAPGDVDIHFEAVTRPGSEFGSGTLVSFELTIPADHPSGNVLIEVVPEIFGLGFSTIDTVAAEAFRLTVGSEPTTDGNGSDGDGTGDAPPADPGDATGTDSDDAEPGDPTDGTGDASPPGPQDTTDTDGDDVGDTGDGPSNDVGEPADTGGDDISDDADTDDIDGDGAADGADTDELDPSTGPRVGGGFCGIGMLGSLLFALLGLMTLKLCRQSRHR